MKQKMVPIVSIAVGLLAFFMTRSYIVSKQNSLRDQEAQMRKNFRTVYVVCAREDLPKGAILRLPDLGKVLVPQATASKAVSTENLESLIDRKLQTRVNKGEPIFWQDIEGGTQTGVTLAPLVQKGLRAISVPVAGASAVSGMVQPGDYVDILGTFTLPSKKNPAESEIATLTLLQNVTVLATGQKMSKNASEQKGSAAASYSSVTVEVTPREAELIVFAQQMQGRLTMTLRNPSDNSDERDLPEVNFEHIEKKLPEYNDIRQRTIRRTRGN